MMVWWENSRLKSDAREKERAAEVAHRLAVLIGEGKAVNDLFSGFVLSIFYGNAVYFLNILGDPLLHPWRSIVPEQIR
jgi:hypothetical protein